MKLCLIALACVGLALASRVEPSRERRQEIFRSAEGSSSSESQEKSTSTENSDEQEKYYDNIIKSRQIKEKVFRSGKEYKYLYNGQVLTGIPGSSAQHAGSRLQAVVTLQFITDTRVVMKLSNVRMAQVNEDIPEPRDQLPFRVFQEVDIQSKFEQKLEKPVEFSYTNGLIHDIALEQGELPWSLNIKRGVLNMLQVNMKEKNRVETEEHQVLNRLASDDSSEVSPKRSRYFRVHETSIEGACDTVYEIGRRPSDEENSEDAVLNITKSVDFTTCSKRPQIKYNWRFQDDCPSCEPKYDNDDDDSEQVIKSSTVVKFNVTGSRDSFMIESVDAESQYTFVPISEETNVVNTYVRKWLQLLSASSYETKIRLSQSTPSEDGMIYSLDWDQWKEKFFMEGETTFQQKTPYSQIPQKTEIVREILKKLVLATAEKVEQDATHWFTRLVTVLRMATRPEIEEIHQQLFDSRNTNSEHFTPEEQKRVKEFLVSGLALSGTKDAISHLVKKIRTRQVTPVTAALALRELMNIRTVSTSMIHEVKSLCTGDVAQESFAVRQSCWLAVGSMLDALCDDNEDELAIEQKMTTEQLCPTSFKSEMVKELFNELKKREGNWEDQMTLIKAIGNAGLDLSIFELEKIIYNKDRRYPTFLRIESIMALRNLRDDMPRKIRKVLMPIYMNPREYPELRITALYEIMNTFPERAILDLIARRINEEPSRQVASFAYSYLNSLANSTNPCYQNMTGDLKLALRFTDPVQPGVQYSKLVHLPFYNEYLESGLDLNLVNIMSNLSLIPSHSAVSLDSTFLGSWTRSLLTVGVASEGLEPMLAKLISKQALNSGFEELFERSPRHIDALPYAKEIRSLIESLKIKSRDYKTPEPKAWAYLKFKGQEVGFAPLTKSMITELTQFNPARIAQIEQRLRQGISVDFTKATILQETELKFTTTLGLPIVYKHKIPAIIGASGKIQLERTSEGMALNVDVKPSFSASSTHSIEIWSPIVNTGLKIRSGIRGFTPIKGKASLNLRNFELKLNFEPIKSAKEILTIESKPITFVQVWPRSIKSWEEPEEKTVMGEEFNRVATYDKSYGKKFLGVEFRVKGRVNTQPYYTLEGTPVWPFSGPNKVSVVLQPTSTVPEEYIVKISGKANQPIDQRESSEIRGYHFKDQSDSSSSSESDETSSEEKRRFASDSSSSSSSSESNSNSDESISMEKNSKELKRRLQENKDRRQQKKNGNNNSRSKSSESTEDFSKEVRVDTAHLRQNELNVEFTTRGNQKRQATFTLIHKYSVGMRYNKLSAKFQRSAIPGDDKPWTVCLNSEVVYPKKPATVEEAKLKKVLATANLKWGESCSESNKYIVMKLQAERSNTQETYEKDMDTIDECQYYEQKGLKSPVSCYSKLAAYADLMKYKVELDYENVPAELRNVTDKLFRFAKYQLYWHTDVASAMVNNPKNKVVAKLTIDPESLQRVNITLKTPRENVTMRFVPLPFSIAPLNTHQSIVTSYLNDLTNDKFEPICKVNDVRIRTFDGVRYEVPISTCYSILAKDCSSEQQFVVMMKRQGATSEAKKVKILTPKHKIVLTGEPRSADAIVKVEVDGSEYQVEAGKAIRENGEVVALIQEEGSYIKVDLREARVRVYFDGYAAHVKASPLYMHRQCGLCGHFDSESRMESEFMSPNFEHTRDVRQFYLDYLVKDTDCQAPSHDSICKDSRCNYEADWNTKNEYDEDRIYRKRSSNKNDKEAKPKMEHDMVEELSRTCFSLNPIPECPEGSYAVNYKIVKDVEYRCVRNSDPRLIDLQHNAEHGRTITKYLTNVREVVTRKVRQPTSCRQH